MPTHVNKALNFTASDLAANRAGRLSDRQRTLARRGAITSLVGPGIIGVGGGAALLFARGFPPPTLNLIVAVVLVVGFGAVGLISARALWQVYTADRVQVAEGAVRIDGAKPLPGRGAYGLEVGGVHLGTRASLAGVVEEGSNWRVYYTPTNHIVVSMEPL